MLILGVRVDNLSREEALRDIESLVLKGQGGHIVTVNPEFIVQARKNGAFRTALNSADIALADGVGITLAAAILGQPLKARLPGVEMVEAVADIASRRGYPLFLLGGGPGVADETAVILRSLYPGLEISGAYSGSPELKDEEPILARINEARPKLLFVAYGAPQQDLWVRRNRARLGSVVAMGVGGSFDYISGRVNRAPLWMRRLGLEWLFRLLHEPWRWRRMLRLPVFASLVVLAALQKQPSSVRR